MLLIMCTLIVASIMAIPYYPILGFFGGLIVIAIEKVASPIKNFCEDKFGYDFFERLDMATNVIIAVLGCILTAMVMIMAWMDL